MTAPARRAAFHALRAVAGGRTDLPLALVESRSHLSDERDRSLTAEIVTGSLRWQRSLDCLIEHFARRPLRRIDPDVAAILRLSLYQLLHLDRVPASAVVDDAVDLTREAKKTSATGFVNAVLRATLRQRHKLPLPPRPVEVRLKADPTYEGMVRLKADPTYEAALAYLGVTHSHPEWLVARWLDRYGFEDAERWVRFNNETPRLTLRANRLRTTREAVAASLAADSIVTEPTAHAPDGLVVVEGNPLRAGSLKASGYQSEFVVQDEASQLISLVVGARPGERVLDLCASPGGKTTAMAADMRDSGMLVASDVRPRRLSLLRETVNMSGANCIRVVRVPESGALPVAPVFDRVLVDAPCSGLGTIRRDPDIRWRRQESDLATLAKGQRTLLGRAAEVVRSGGRLVYATCSSEPEENERVVEAFLDLNSDFELVDLRAGASVALVPFLDPRGMMRTLPFRDGLEAFFAAALMRR